MAVCPHCRHESSGRFFCDRCHTLLPLADSTPLPEQVQLREGLTVDCTGFGGYFRADCWRPVETTCGGEPCRVYALNPNWWLDLSAAVGQRSRNHFDVLAPLEVVPVAEGAVVVARALAGASRPLAEPPPADADPLARLDDAVAAGRLLARALGPLHRAGLLWLNFDPAGLLVVGDRVQVAGLDLRLFPAGAYPDSLSLSPLYSPPEVFGFRGDRLGPATDVFHAAAYLWYRLAGLLPGGLPGAGLEAIDFELPPLRIYNSLLPPGVAPVLARGLARDPADRFASLDDFAAALEDAAARARRRARSTAPVRLDAGAASAAGKSHEVRGLPNQDAHLLATPAPDTLLAIVADGVTHARIGSGDQASRIAVEVLSSILVPLAPVTPPPELDDMIQGACLEAARAILDAAFADGPAEEGSDPVDVMSSTVVLGVAQGNELTLASAGDSRAYLLHEGVAEQLTVDGDLRCARLAAGVAPEQVREAGAEGLALYSCLGIGEPGPGGHFVPCVERSQPRLSRWKLLPGDVVVLCSDGLVEEGVFLEPADLVALLTGETDRPAGELAERLVAAAKGRHREPSEQEPEGCGDDVTCVVVVVRSA
jgi:serine/threonine protein phosphatase PrpC